MTTNKTNTANVSASAMLAVVTIHGWTGRRKDTEATGLVHDKFDAESEEAGVYVKKLFTPNVLSLLTEHTRKCRKIHKKYTLPWQERAVRILSGEMFFDWQKEIEAKVSDLNTALDSFLKAGGAYDQQVKTGPKRLGKMWDAALVPSKEEMRKRFRIEYKVLPFPTSGDFRVTLKGGESKVLRAQIEKDIMESVEQAQRDLVQRVANAAKRLSEQCRKVSDEKERGRITGAVFSELNHLSTMLKTSNLTDQSNLKALQKDIARLAKFDSATAKAAPGPMKKDVDKTLAVIESAFAVKPAPPKVRKPKVKVTKKVTKKTSKRKTK